MTVANNFANLVKVNNTTAGTGTITLGSVISGFRGTSVLTNGAVYAYTIIGSGTYEDGYGTYSSSGTTLTRGPVDSSNSNAAVSLIGTEVVIIGHILAQDVANLLNSPGSNTNIYFNDSGYANAASNLTWNKSSNTLVIAGANITANTITLIPDSIVTVNVTSNGSLVTETSFTDSIVNINSKIYVSILGVADGYADELDFSPRWAYGRCAANGTIYIKVISLSKMWGNTTVSYILD